MDRQLLFTDRLNKACDLAGIPIRGRATYLQKHLPFDISLVGVRKWLVGESIPNTKKLSDIASLLGTTVESLLDSDEIELRDTNSDKEFWGKIKNKQIPNSQFLDSQNLKAIPILSQVQAGDWKRIVVDQDTEFEWQTVSANTSDQAFALRVTGNSMTNPHGAPSIPAGSIVVVEPCSCPDNGKIVVATLNDAPEATIKKLEIDGPHRFLVPLNPKYDPIPINGNCRIVGYVKQVIMNL
ncbi:Cro/Cl family transcriptional regulator [Vibrio sp. 03-59-1]|uniref:S24 family peptidase n=1 Tax=Vibrio sp. 03-59-1 TaxID=2607607 RepID=UPI0014939893|nr:S24 family peptidase [Vibrio sp. 03-59-1]NOH85511.1 Cro/Cl family transcriptional regulator [Vibrio sp. 03-59-1]